MDDYNARRLEREEGKAEGLKLGIRQGKKEGLKEGEVIGIAKGKADGLKEGEAIGVTNATKEIALNMISMNLSDEQIQQATGLSLEEIKKLK